MRQNFLFSGPAAAGQHAASPRLAILEQPAEFHQFRYEAKDPTDSRLGGKLKGRNSGRPGYGETFVKLRVSGITPGVSRLRIMGCTLTPNNAPHPYKLHGDHCREGFYCYEIAPPSAAAYKTGEFPIVLERFSIISVRVDEIDAALQIRQQNASGFHPAVKQQPQQQPQGKKNYNELRLCFQLFYSMQGDEAALEQASDIVISEVIKNKKANFTIDCVFPESGSLNGGQKFWIYFKKPLAVKDQRNTYEVLIEEYGRQDSSLTITPLEVRQNLVTFETPSNLRNRLGHSESTEKIYAHLRVVCRATGQESQRDVVHIEFLDSCAHCMQCCAARGGQSLDCYQPPTKQQRQELTAAPAVVDYAAPQEEETCDEVQDLLNDLFNY